MRNEYQYGTHGSYKEKKVLLLNQIILHCTIFRARVEAYLNYIDMLYNTNVIFILHQPSFGNKLI